MTETRKVGRPFADPETKKMPLATKLPRWLLDWLRSPERNESIAVMIEQSLRKVYKLKKPADEKASSGTNLSAGLGDFS